MLKLFGFCIKLTLVTLTVLVLGNYLRWDGKTISDQVKWRMAHAEKTFPLGDFSKWAKEITEDARQGFRKKLSQSSPAEGLPTSSERQKLRSLIRELNSSYRED